MIINASGVDITKRLTEEQLMVLSKNLADFLDSYWKNIVIKDEEKLMTFRKLDKISHYLKTRQYDELFDDTGIIMTESDMNRFD